MSKRSKPGAVRTETIGTPEQDKHQNMLDEMHQALYALGDKIRKPFMRGGEKLLPPDLREAPNPEAKTARKHISNLYSTMKRGGRK